MCLGIPAQVLERGDDGGLLTGVVDFGGTRRHVCLACTPEARPGDYVIVHAGFAIAVLDEPTAAERLALLHALADGDAP